MLPDPAAKFLAEALAKRDLGLALSRESARRSDEGQTPVWDCLLPNLLAPIGAQLGSARAHYVVGRRDIGLVSSAGNCGQRTVL